MTLPFNPGKCRLLQCTVNGSNLANVDASVHCTGIKVYESMCKPYITCQFTIVDSINFINGMRLRGGEQVDFEFDGGGGPVYAQTQYVLALNGEQQSDSLRTIVYTLDTVGYTYMGDRANMVQRADVSKPATEVMRAIHGEFLADKGLSIPVPSSGPVAKMEGGSNLVLNQKPITAIENLLRESKFAAYPTQSGIYFRNAQEHVIAPLEYLFSSAGSQGEFFQRRTWGSDYLDTLGGGLSIQAILAAETIIKDENSSRGGAGRMAGAVGARKAIYDVANKVSAINQAAQAAGFGGSMLGSAASAVGKFMQGVDGAFQAARRIDSRLKDLANDPAPDMGKAEAYQAQIKDSVNYLVKVYIQPGISLTVGKGATIHLVPAMGDLNSGQVQGIGGKGLLADVMHEVWFDNRPLQGTTTFRLVQGYSYGVGAD